MESETDSKPESIEARVEGMVTGIESDNPVKGADVAVLRTDEEEQLGQTTQLIPVEATRSRLPFRKRTLPTSLPLK